MSNINQDNSDIDEYLDPASYIQSGSLSLLLLPDLHQNKLNKVLDHKLAITQEEESLGAKDEQIQVAQILRTRNHPTFLRIFSNSSTNINLETAKIRGRL